MVQVTVSEEALRELVREALDGGHLGDLTVPEDEAPVNVNDVVDPSAAVTDPINPDFVPQTKPELDVAIRQLTKDVPIEKVPGVYKSLRAVIDADNARSEEDETMKKAAQGGTEQVEEAVRRAVRKMLGTVMEASPLPPVKKIPFGVHGGEYMARMQKTRDDLASNLGKSRLGAEEDDAPEEDETPATAPKRPKAYKKMALGGMSDVSGASFEDIAKELNFSVAGAKQAVDKALLKARWMATEIDPDDLEILVLTTMNEYIAMLSKTGELSSADVQLMKDHPDVVRDLEGFREFLDTAIRRKRKEGQKLVDPIGEHRKRVAEALGSVGMGFADDGPPDSYADDPAYQEYLSRGPECPMCGGENTSMNEPMPSMMGHGADESLHCADCDQDFAMNPFTGEFGGGKGKRSHLASEAKKPAKKLAKKKKPGDFTKRMDKLDADNYEKYGSPSGWGKKDKD